MSPLEAKTFSKVSALAVESNGVYFIPNDLDLLRSFDVYMGDLSLLQDCSLLNIVRMEHKLEFFSDHDASLSNACILGLIGTKNYDDGSIQLSGCQLTGTGHELLRLSQSDENNLKRQSQFLLQYLKIIRESNHWARVTAFRITDKLPKYTDRYSANTVHVNYTLEGPDLMIDI